MHIAILGTGHMATTIAGGLLAAGHTVTFGSRNPDAHQDLVAPAATTADAISGAGVVVNALQAAFSLESLTPLASALTGKILIDIGNAVTPAFELLYPNDSLGERLQAALPGTHVVKSLNTLPGTLAIAPTSIAEPTSVFLSGDDQNAKAVVSSILVDLGWQTTQQVDLGGIDSARGAEHYFLMFVSMMQAFHGRPFNIRIVR